MSASKPQQWSKSSDPGCYGAGHWNSGQRITLIWRHSPADDLNLLHRNQATTPEAIVTSGLDDHKIALDLLQ